MISTGALTWVGVAGLEPTASSSRITGSKVTKVVYAAQSYYEVRR